jgi:hypothetical protein
MTGMKEGAGEDPFADDNSETDTTRDTEPTQTDDEPRDTADDPAIEGGSTLDTESTTQRSMEIPYKFRRDSVQDGRDRVPLFLHDETKTAERQAMRELEDRFDDSVSMTDLREALVKVGLNNLDETASALEEWGYGMTFD